MISDIISEVLDIASRNSVTNPAGSGSGGVYNTTSTVAGSTITVPIFAYVGIPVVFVLGFAGSLLPPLIASYFPNYDLLTKNYFKFFNGFAAGIVLAVGFVHSIPDSFANASQALTNGSLTDNYAWPGFIAMMGALITFAIEEGVVSYFGAHSHDSPTPVEVSSKRNSVIEATTLNNPMLDIEKAESSSVQDEIDAINKLLTDMWTLWMGLSFHSVFVGLALGVTGDDYSLFSAIVAHQFFEGVALGARVARSRLPKRWQIWVVDFAYAVTAPVGTAIGLGVRYTILYQQNAYSLYVYAIVDFVIQGLSAGILIYVGLVHMMKEEMERKENRRALLPRLCLFSGFLLGAGAMSVIGIWA